MNTFSERFNKVIQETKLTGAEISRLLGIHPPTLSKYIHGNSGMSLETLYRFCKVFNVSADWLLGLENTKEGRNENMSKLDEFYEKVMEIIAHAEDNQFITEEAATILRQNINEAKDDSE